MKCALCGKFRKKTDLVMMQAEGEETWLECIDCMSESDKERYFKK